MKGYSSFVCFLLIGALSASILFEAAHKSELPESKKMQIQIIRRPQVNRIANILPQAHGVQRITRQNLPVYGQAAPVNRLAVARRAQNMPVDTSGVTFTAGASVGGTGQGPQEYENHGWDQNNGNNGQGPQEYENHGWDQNNQNNGWSQTNQTTQNETWESNEQTTVTQTSGNTQDPSGYFANELNTAINNGNGTNVTISHDAALSIVNQLNANSGVLDGQLQALQQLDAQLRLDIQATQATLDGLHNNNGSEDQIAAAVNELQTLQSSDADVDTKIKDVTVAQINQQIGMIEYERNMAISANASADVTASYDGQISKLQAEALAVSSDQQPIKELDRALKDFDNYRPKVQRQGGLNIQAQAVSNARRKLQMKVQDLLRHAGPAKM